MMALLLWLLVFARAALAGATWQAAPEPPERPAIAAPVGGWWEEDGQYARIHASPADQATARRLADHAARSVPALARRIGVPAGGTIDVYLAPSQADFAEMQPGAPPDWADGTAWPRWGLVFLRAPSARPGTAEPLEQVLDHELVHVLLGRAFLPGTPPRWLQEGLAQYWTGELGPEVGDTLGSVVFGRDQLFSLTELSRGFYGDPIQARNAYAAAADFFGFLASTHGEDSVRRLVAAMADGEDLDGALLRATGQTRAEIEAAWQGRWNDPAILAKALVSSDLLWGAAGALAVVGAWRVRRRTRRTMARWEREEEWKRRMEEIALHDPSPYVH